MEWVKNVDTCSLRLLELALLESHTVFTKGNSNEEDRKEYFKLKDNIQNELKLRF